MTGSNGPLNDEVAGVTLMTVGARPDGNREPPGVTVRGPVVVSPW